MKQAAANKIKNLSKTELLRSLLSLMMEQEYKEISITSICNHSGFSRQTFYRHYTSKDEIIHNYLISLMEDLYESIRNLEDKTAETILLEFINLWSSHRYLTRSLIHSNSPYISLPLMIDFIEKSSIHKMILPPSSTEIFLYFYAGGLYSCIRHWIESNYHLSERELVQQILSVFSSTNASQIHP